MVQSPSDHLLNGEYFLFILPCEDDHREIETRDKDENKIVWHLRKTSKIPLYRITQTSTTLCGGADKVTIMLNGDL